MEPATERVPAEIWLEIFEQLPKGTDLHSISITCRKFNQLSARALHRDVVWYRAKLVAHDLNTWERNVGMEAAVRSLVLGVSRLPQGLFASAVERDGRMSQSTGVDARSTAIPWAFEGLVDRISLNIVDNSFAAPSLHTEMWEKIEAFKNLSTLTFANMFVLPEHFLLIHSLQQLRTLRIDTCAVCSRSSHAPQALPSHVALPITDLALFNIRRSSRSPILPPNGIDDVSYALSLCVAQGLRRLAIDASSDVFRHVFGAWDAQARGWTIPPTLEHLYVRKRVVGVERPSLFAVDHAFPDTHLYHFCVQAKSLRTVSTPIFVPAQVAIAPEALPSGLERFCAPLETAQLVAAVRDLKALGLLKCGVAAREGITALAGIGQACPGLRMLLVEFKGWDEEIFSAAAQLFKELRRLKVVYEEPGPTEVSLESSCFLRSYPVRAHLMLGSHRIFSSRSRQSSSSICLNCIPSSFTHNRHPVPGDPITPRRCSTPRTSRLKKSFKTLSYHGTGTARSCGRCSCTQAT